MLRPRTLGLAAALAMTVQLAYAGDAPAPGCPVSVTIQNIKTVGGHILAALYDESDWGEKSVAVARIPVTSQAPALCLRPPGAGRYAIRLFHDLDADGRLQSNILGLPTEPFGFSNDAPIQFGPPTFAAAAFDLGESGVVQSITLR